MTKELLNKLINNNCYEEDLNNIIKWIQTESLSKSSKQIILEDWESFHPDRSKDADEKYSMILDKIHHKINLETNRHKLPFYENRAIVWFSRAAAILILPVLAVLFYTLYNQMFKSSDLGKITTNSVEVIAPIGSRSVIQLSEGTTVHLNYGSRIKYPYRFEGGTRTVELSGEGFFEVAHNPDMPFIVKTGKINVKALGTKFNVLAYADQDIVAATLVEGKVVIDKVWCRNKNERIYNMVAGQHLSINTKTGKMRSTKDNIEKYIAWKEGRIVFQNAPISEVAVKLNRIFNVDIEIEDDIRDFTYTVTFVDEPLFQILDLMAIATPVSYKAIPRTKLKDGTFSKQKILISRKK